MVIAIFAALFQPQQRRYCLWVAKYTFDQGIYRLLDCFDIGMATIAERVENFIKGNRSTFERELGLLKVGLYLQT